MPNTEQLLYQSDQKQPPKVLYKKAVLKNFATGKHLRLFLTIIVSY